MALPTVYGQGIRLVNETLQKQLTATQDSGTYIQVTSAGSQAKYI